MKVTVLTIIFLPFLLLSCFDIHGQENKNSISIAPFLNTYTGHLLEGSEKYRNSINPVKMSPGIEFTYFRKFMKQVEIGTGIIYSYSNTFSVVEFNQVGKSWKLHFNEINIPFLLRIFIPQKQHYPSYFTFGFDIGRIFDINSEYFLKNWSKEKVNNVPYYSTDLTYNDILLDFGWSKEFKNTNTIALTPFCKYRINKTWLNHHHSRFQYGFKIIYTLKF